MKTLARASDKAEVLRRLERVRPERAPLWGRMSAHQMVCHLADAIRMATGQKRVSQATSLPRRTIVKWIALYAPARWPTGIPTRPEIDQELDGTRPGDFAADIAQLEALLDLITAPAPASAPAKSFEWQVHPIFGGMSEAAWLRWAYLHLDHHLRQFDA